MPSQEDYQVSTQALKQITKGKYERDVNLTSNVNTIAGTEFELTELAANLVATSTDELLLWARYQFLVIDETPSHLVYEWMLIRCLSTASLQDLNDSATIEALQKEGRILKKGTSYSAHPSYSRKIEKIELYKVVIPAGEELRMVVRPVIASGNAAGVFAEILEWRFAGTAA